MATVTVVGAGWAGIAAAVRAVEAGHRVTLIEMAPHAGGRARTVEHAGEVYDNGQHILIGAYERTLALMASVGADTAALLCRLPLELRFPDGFALALPRGPAALAFVRGVIACRGWTAGERAALLFGAAEWALRGFRCDPELTVTALCRRLPAAVRERLVDPLCIAALNTPAAAASAQVLLRVLRDALFGARGASDLLLPRRPLGALLPEPALRWLRVHGADIRLAARVRKVEPDGARWRVDADPCEAVVLACSAIEAARLAEPVAPAWAATAAALRYEPIVAVALRCPGARLPAPMLALRESAAAPAQFAFDHGALGGIPGRFVFVISGAGRWVERGLDATAAAVRTQAEPLLPAATVVEHALAEKRATFRCVPGLARPPAVVAPGLYAAGDYVDGPYPATLEGAVRAGEHAARLVNG